MGVAGDSHLPLEQISPLGQEFTQVPQCLGSVIRLKHPSKQLVCSEEQVTAQLPFRQFFPSGQEFSQYPQFMLSVLASVHAPLHAILSEGQMGALVTGAGVRPAVDVVTGVFVKVTVRDAISSVGTVVLTSVTGGVPVSADRDIFPYAVFVLPLVSDIPFFTISATNECFVELSSFSATRSILPTAFGISKYRSPEFSMVCGAPEML